MFAASMRNAGATIKRVFFTTNLPPYNNLTLAASMGVTAAAAGDGDDSSGGGSGGRASAVVDGQGLSHANFSDIHSSVV